MKKNKKLFNKVVEQKGNCEDLLFNYEFHKLYKKIPTLINGKLKHLDGSNGFSTNKNIKHMSLRKKFCKLLN